MSSNRFDDKSVAWLLGAAAGIIAVAFLALAFQAWLLGMILSWFSIKFSFWQCFAIIFLLNSIFSAAKSSK